MDFPLVSIAMSHDQYTPLDTSKTTPLIQALPIFATFYSVLQAADKRTDADWKATAAGQVLMRNGTSTRSDYERMGVMKGLAYWLMRQAKLLGYRGIQIECAHPAVSYVWLHPPVPFTAEVISSFHTAEYEEVGTDGVSLHPFAPGKAVCTKDYVTL